MVNSRMIAGGSTISLSLTGAWRASAGDQ